VQFATIEKAVNSDEGVVRREESPPADTVWTGGKEVLPKRYISRQYKPVEIVDVGGVGLQG
jgi:hypothetical protein